MQIALIPLQIAEGKIARTLILSAQFAGTLLAQIK